MKTIGFVVLACFALAACGDDDPTPDTPMPDDPMPDDPMPDAPMPDAPMPDDGRELVFTSSPDEPLADPGFTDDVIFIEEPGFIRELSVELDIQHSRVFELRVSLVHSRTGIRIDLARNPSSAGDDMVFELRDGADLDVQDDVNFDIDDGPAYADAPHNPYEPLRFFRGDPIEGVWILEIFDFTGGDTGRLRSWTLRAVVDDEAPAAALVVANPRVVLGAGSVGVTQDQAVRYRYTGQSGAPLALNVLSGDVQASISELPSDGPVKTGVISYAANSAGPQALELELAAGGETASLSWTTEFAPIRASGLSLVSQLSMAQLGYPGFEGNDCWGWTDPQTGVEYALMGAEAGLSFVDISDASAPVVLGTLDTHTFLSAWRDVKVYQDHAFIVSEASGHGMQVFDLTELRELDGSSIVALSETAHFDGFGNAHNIVIDEQSGFAYVVGATEPFDGSCGGGLLMIDISTPTAPVDAGCFGGGVPVVADPGRDYPTTAYIHDAQCITYDGPDTDYVGRQLCVSSDGQLDESRANFIGIADVTDKAEVVQVARIEYPESGYAHQGWLSEDHRYFFLNDEFDEFTLSSPTRTLVFDLVDLERPVFVGAFENPSLAVGHNTYIVDGRLYMANYTSGLRIVELNPDEQGAVSISSMQETGFFDTYPDDDSFNDGLGIPRFSGAWSNYPFFDSGNILVSDIERGLFIVR